MDNGNIINNVTIKLCSYNCKGVERAMPHVNEVCNAYDIVFLQEHWLSDMEIDVLNQVHSNMYSAGVSAMNSGDSLLRGRPHGYLHFEGGCAILYSTSEPGICMLFGCDQGIR